MLNGYPRYEDIPPSFPAIGSIWEHVASGKSYRVMLAGVDEPSWTLAVGYVPVEPAPPGYDYGRWRHPEGVARLPIFRRLDEFEDGRFRQVE